MTGNNTKKHFIVTVDTEGDNLWDPPETIETKNAAYIPRFQALCERYRFKPVYLVDYEIACDPRFVEFALDRLKQDACEVGMHLHARNTPPLHPSESAMGPRPYLIDYPYAVMDEKIRVMTECLEDKFNRKIISHRAGRWALDSRYLELLEKHGYRIDCSVTPHVDWSGHPGATGTGGADYSSAPETPYRIHGRILEVPVTIRRSRSSPQAGIGGKLKSALLGRAIWMRPSQNGLDDMVRLVNTVHAEKSTDCLQFMIHSSELMPGGSPYFVSEASVKSLYDTLEQLFDAVKDLYEGITLSGYREKNVRYTEAQVGKERRLAI